MKPEEYVQQHQKAFEAQGITIKTMADDIKEIKRAKSQGRNTTLFAILAILSVCCIFIAVFYYLGYTDAFKSVTEVVCHDAENNVICSPPPDIPACPTCPACSVTCNFPDEIDINVDGSLDTTE